MRGHRRSDLAHAVSLTIGRDRKLEGDYVEDDEARSLTPDGRGKAGRSRQLIGTLIQFLRPNL